MAAPLNIDRRRRRQTDARQSRADHSRASPQSHFPTSLPSLTSVNSALRTCSAHPWLTAPMLKSLSENSEGRCGEGFWPWPRRRGWRIPATGCAGRANAGHGKKDPAARRASRKSAVWLRCSSVEDPPGIFSLVAPRAIRPFPPKTAPFIIFRQALNGFGCGFGIRISDFFRNSDFGLRILIRVHPWLNSVALIASPLPPPGRAPQ